MSVEQLARELEPAKVPATELYTLRGFMLAGSEIPEFTMGSSMVQIKLSIGTHTIVFTSRQNRSGQVRDSSVAQSHHTLTAAGRSSSASSSLSPCWSCRRT